MSPTCPRSSALSAKTDAATLLDALALAVLPAFKERDARLCRGAHPGLLCGEENKGVRVTDGYQRLVSVVQGR